MVDLLLLFAVGIVVGLFGTLLGIGGGFIVVPFLSIVYNLSPQFAVGTSIIIVAFNALSGTLAYARQKRIDYQTGVMFALATIPGAFGGAWILQYVPKTTFEVSFAIFIFLVVGYIAFRKEPKGGSDYIDLKTFHRPEYSKPLGIFISFLVGFLASMAGIGGGVIHVPAMIYLFSFPPFIAIPTSHFILAISATFAAISHAIVGEVDWNFVPSLGLGAIIGAQIAGKVSHKIKNKLIIRGLLMMMLFAAVRLIVKHI